MQHIEVVAYSQRGEVFTMFTMFTFVQLRAAGVYREYVKILQLYIFVKSGNVIYVFLLSINVGRVVQGVL